ncbi:hypothetical protein FISHEDRAFT_59002, partial [Fistulina hepatica ATCC 64428]
MSSSTQPSAERNAQFTMRISTLSADVQRARRGLPVAVPLSVRRGRRAGSQVVISSVHQQYFESRFPHLERELRALNSLSFQGLAAIYHLYRRHLMLVWVCKTLQLKTSRPNTGVRVTFSGRNLTVAPVDVISWTGRAWGTYYNA